MTTVAPIQNPSVAEVFAGYPVAVRSRLLALRTLILETAAATHGVGALEETLKWGEPAYLTTQSRSGSTIRLGWKASAPTKYAMYFNCQTSLLDTFRTHFPTALRYDGDRAIVFDVQEPVPVDAVSWWVAAALTYHRRSRRTP